VTEWGVDESRDVQDKERKDSNKSLQANPLAIGLKANKKKLKKETCETNGRNIKAGDGPKREDSTRRCVSVTTNIVSKMFKQPC